MPERSEQQLRVLIANENPDRLDLLAEVVVGLGHEVVASETEVKGVGAVTAREHPDVALVGLGTSTEHALKLISEIAGQNTCPVIAMLHDGDPDFVHKAAKRGVFAHTVDGDPAELQSAIDIALRLFHEYQGLQGAFDRRAQIEQAKGILMARHSIAADEAFDRLRDHSQNSAGQNSATPPQPSSKATSYFPTPPEPPTSTRLGECSRCHEVSVIVRFGISCYRHFVAVLGVKAGTTPRAHQRCLRDRIRPYERGRSKGRPNPSGRHSLRFDQRRIANGDLSTGELPAVADGWCSTRGHAMKASVTIHVETLWTNRAELNVEAELDNPHSETNQEVVSMMFEAPG